MSTDFNAIKAGLAHLNSKQLKQIKSLCDFYLQKAGSDGAVSSDPDAAERQLCYDKLREAAVEAGYTNLPTYPLLKRGRWYTLFQSAYTGIAEFTRTHFPDARRDERLALYKLYGRLLVKAAQRQGKDVDVRLFCLNLNRVPNLIEEAYPGYLQAGVIDVVADQFFAKGTEETE